MENRDTYDQALGTRRTISTQGPSLAIIAWRFAQILRKHFSDIISKMCSQSDGFTPFAHWLQANTFGHALLLVWLNGKVSDITDSAVQSNNCCESTNEKSEGTYGTNEKCQWSAFCGTYPVV